MVARGLWSTTLVRRLPMAQYCKDRTRLVLRSALPATTRCSTPSALTQGFGVRLLPPTALPAPTDGCNCFAGRGAPTPLPLTQPTLFTPLYPGWELFQQWPSTAQVQEKLWRPRPS